MNKMPGFTGEASLAPTTRVYRANTSSDGKVALGDVVPMQFIWIGPVPPPPASPSPFFPLPFGPQPPIGWQPPPPPPPPVPLIPPGGPQPPVVLGGAGAAGAGAAGGISLLWLIPGVIVGVGLGAAVGFGTEYILTPEITTPPLPSGGCRPTSPSPVRETITGCYWGANRSLAKTMNDAHAYCEALASSGYCAGTCPDGTPCKALTIANPRPEQNWCWAGAIWGNETIVDVKCLCGC